MRTCSRNDHIQCESKNDSACKICPVKVSNEETRKADYRKFLKAKRESNAAEYKKLLKAQKRESRKHYADWIAKYEIETINRILENMKNKNEPKKKIERSCSTCGSGGTDPFDGVCFDCEDGSKWYAATNLNISNYDLHCEIKELHKKIDDVAQLLALHLKGKDIKDPDDLWQVFRSLPDVSEPLLIIDAYKRNGNGEKEYVRRNQFCLFEGTNKECQNFVKQWKKENGYE